MTTNYVEEHQHLEARLAQLGQELPGPMTGFARLHRKAVEDGALAMKVKEMMALAIGITVGVALLMSGGPGSIYAAHALDAIEQFMPVMTEAGTQGDRL